MSTPNEQKMILLAARIQAQLVKNLNKGLNNARVFLTSRIKEEVSVPAPRKRAKDREGNIYYRATTRATPGAPPRKLSGKLRMSITSLMLTNRKAVIGVKARSPKGANYPAILEHGSHPFMVPTYRKWKKEIVQIVGRSVKGIY